jgi:hypothetical protein
MIKTNGANKIPLLFKAIAQGVDFDTALKQTVGMDVATLEKQWQEMLILGDQNGNIWFKPYHPDRFERRAGTILLP